MTEPVVPTPETDEQESRRLYLLTKSGEATSERRQAWVITLRSGKEIVLVIPERIGRELASMGGYVGRVRPAKDDDNVTIGEPSVSRLKARRQERMGGDASAPLQ